MNLQRVFAEQGQSPWLDNLQRSYLLNGELEKLIQRGVRGLTSNPTIFQKAIQGSSDYDKQFSREIRSGRTPLEAYWELVISDIIGAIDLFENVYRESEGTDGFVSVEVDPRRAHDVESTLSAARSLHEAIARPNVMIKIPATSEGLPAITQLIAEGINVNVTLIFSLDRYSQVIDAYIEGLKRRCDSGGGVSHIQSVASFFISRVDAEVDKMLEAVTTDAALALRGRTAINQAKLAYRIFQDKFSGPSWNQLAAQGARVQRPLWASTSTKNPTYRDTLYVDELIGPNTVNTLPDSTLHAFDDHGTVRRTIDTDMATTEDEWNELNHIGIEIEKVSQKLETEGVASFISSFDDLLATLEEKQKIL